MSAQQPADQGVSPSMPSVPGTLVGSRMRKWDGGDHWRFDARYLGRDEHGTWLGYRPGTYFSRPGLAYHAKSPGLVVFGPVGWVAELHRGHPRGTLLYIDLTTVPEWHAVPDADGGPEFVVTAADMDLDVIARTPGSRDARRYGETYIDDEDEFAEHSVRYGYPPSVIERVRSDADALLAAVRAGEPPYDGATAKRWFAVLDGL
ncbi:hypothetical protein ACIG47_03775 [Promicromonospora sp. NPDC052451]|uniref:hypothetical protein n=1 Tax=Promicromonospora sp. NPDC052451 TaxID=3364407 RepID=UPI0037C92212